MSFLHVETVRARARLLAASRGQTPELALLELSRRRLAHYDIFLSQTIRDPEIVLGVYEILTSAGHTVFCDWIEQPGVERSQVTPANAAFIRRTMNISDTFLFLDTEGAAQSLWMCWELGWFDGHRGPVAILPVLDENAQYYRGREFLGLYPYVEIDANGQLRIVRPVVAGPTGVMMFEAPNSRSFGRWRSEGGDFMRPRVIGGYV